jgi:hypothetical protein
MNARLLAVLLAVSLTGSAIAQDVGMPYPTLNENIVMGSASGNAGLAALALELKPTVWVDAQFLLYWLKNNNVNVPLIQSQRLPLDLARSFEAGGINDPNSFTLFGNEEVENNPFPGGRLFFGFGLDQNVTLGAEIGGFWLPRQVETFNIASNAQGVPSIGLVARFQPGGIAGSGGESGGAFAGPFAGSFLQGRAEAISATQLWGAEANGLIKLFSWKFCRVDGIAGFRYLGMNDLLSLNAATTGGGDGEIYDRFSTENHFYGGQLGARFTCGLDKLNLAFTVKEALGAQQELLDINGNSVLPSFAGGGASNQGGFYTATSNMGRTTTTRFGSVTDLNLNLNVGLTKNLTVSAGYNFLYWNRVMRSGQQIDRVLNANLNPAFGAGTDRSGPRSPTRLNAEDDFWAHGLNLGFQLKF